MPASNDIVDETTVRLAYNGILLRDANTTEITPRIQSRQTVEALMRELIDSAEHKRIQYDRQFGQQAEASQAKSPSAATVLAPGNYVVK